MLRGAKGSGPDSWRACGNRGDLVATGEGGSKAGGSVASVCLGGHTDATDPRMALRADFLHPPFDAHVASLLLDGVRA